MQLRGFPGTAVRPVLLIRMHANIPIKARAGETVYTRYPLAPPATGSSRGSGWHDTSLAGLVISGPPQPKDSSITLWTGHAEVATDMNFEWKLSGRSAEVFGNLESAFYLSTLVLDTRPSMGDTPRSGEPSSEYRRAAGVSNQVSWTLYWNSDAATGTTWRARAVRVKANGLQLDVARRLRFDSRKPLALLAMTATGVCVRTDMPS